MESCWLIEFKDGDKMIISESIYQEENVRNFGGREVLCEQHWFDYETCRKRNRGVLVVGFQLEKENFKMIYEDLKSE